MIDFFQMIGTVLKTILNLVITFVESIVQFFTLCFEFVSYLGTVVSYIPAPLVAFIMIGISVSVILMIIGRN